MKKTILIKLIWKPKLQMKQERLKSQLGPKPKLVIQLLGPLLALISDFCFSLGSNKIKKIDAELFILIINLIEFSDPAKINSASSKFRK